MGASPNLSDAAPNERAHATNKGSPSAKATVNDATTYAMTGEVGSTASDGVNYDTASETPIKTLEIKAPDVVASKDDILDSDDAKERRPPLPPRRSLLQTPERPKTSGAPKRPVLQSQPTTALSSVDIQTLSFPDGTRGTFSTAASRSVSETKLGHGVSSSVSSLSKMKNLEGSDNDDNASLMSYAPTLKANGDLASLLDDGLNAQSPAWKLLNSQADHWEPIDEAAEFEDTSLTDFDREFDEIGEVDSKGGNEEELLIQWKSKLKHYLILSSAGKPIYSRHGDQNLINGYIGIIQTIISFYEGSKDPLTGFTAGRTRFVISTDGPLYFVAISKLGESDAQLKGQLEALYMQILSTLTLPTLTHLFSNRPNTDLRRPLEGTESLLSSLADTFTKGSPSALLSALECLKLRKSQRHVINNTLLKARTDKLLYGLIVAGGRLVSVIRPKRHSLHPSDLQLIFNMLFEAGGVRAGGGENWIPLCLPGFNNRGYLYMYVSFLSVENGEPIKDNVSENKKCKTEDEVAVLLISADKESFFELKQMRDEVVNQLEKNGSMKIIKAAVRQGRPKTTDIAPGTPLRHFLYKSRANVQFTMPSFDPYYNNLVNRRRLMNRYQNLHSATHKKHSHLKVLHCVSRDSISLAWTTPQFEFYCVAGPNASRAGLAQGANRIIQWVKREEERVFIVGGAVF
ncbi:Bcmon1 [Botrytis cinerea B05.10]|uniref:Vacuolar fusion protein MON1 n=3 Tax=Botryotinia fuckeliana TaxID=40559 RepID=A0A384JKN0_BOTFB|nr:Bcmon1 [Botrytis cinerea B05.10]ATZ51145.1 Bcmon1 [Botrytis cinerea B05.10]EMR87537.1 putative vacuolar fusion protein mon1 protein [Botrytis cinerea BcDW1]